MKTNTFRLRIAASLHQVTWFPFNELHCGTIDYVSFLFRNEDLCNGFDNYNIQNILTILFCNAISILINFKIT